METTYKGNSTNNNTRNVGGRSQINVNRGDIWYIDLGEKNNSMTGNIGSEQSGRRLFLITSNNRGNFYSPCVIGISLTSQLSKAKLPTHIELSRNEFTFLDKDSVVLAEKPRDCDKSRLIEYVGKLPEEKMLAIDKAIAVSVGLDSMIQNQINKEKQEIIKQQREKEIIEVEETIEDMVNSINELEQFALRESTSNPEEFLRVRKIQIAGLKKYCNKKNVDIFDYYNEEDFEIRFENLKKYAESLGNNKSVNIRPMMPISAMSKYNTIAVTC